MDLILTQRNSSSLATTIHPLLMIAVYQTPCSITPPASHRTWKNAAWVMSYKSANKLVAEISFDQSRIAARNRRAEITFRCAKSRLPSVVHQVAKQPASDWRKIGAALRSHRARLNLQSRRS